MRKKAIIVAGVVAVVALLLTPFYVLNPANRVLPVSALALAGYTQKDEGWHAMITVSNALAMPIECYVNSFREMSFAKPAKESSSKDPFNQDDFPRTIKWTHLLPGEKGAVGSGFVESSSGMDFVMLTDSVMMERYGMAPPLKRVEPGGVETFEVRFYPSTGTPVVLRYHADLSRVDRMLNQAKQWLNNKKILRKFTLKQPDKEQIHGTIPAVVAESENSAMSSPASGPDVEDVEDRAGVE